MFYFFKSLKSLKSNLYLFDFGSKILQTFSRFIWKIFHLLSVISLLLIFLTQLILIHHQLINLI
nr:MAG TPA: hypothetical protein [Bacteriophage sp.]